MTDDVEQRSKALWMANPDYIISVWTNIFKVPTFIALSYIDLYI